LLSLQVRKAIPLTEKNLAVFDKDEDSAWNMMLFHLLGKNGVEKFF
jgi:hypothetical protein